MEADFSGYATKAGLRCSDGRTITAEAFKHMDGMTVPLVWQHGHDTPENVLGHGILEARDDGMYVQGFFNDTPPGQHAKALVIHKDITSLSIYANQLVEKAKTVLHGMIREVSLVISGANPGARIENVRVAHSEFDTETLDDEAIITMDLGLEFQHAEDDTNLTIQDVLDSMDDTQREVVAFMVAEALKSGSTEHSDLEPEVDNTDEDTPDDGAQNTGNTDEKDNNLMHRNVFEQNKQGVDGGAADAPTLSHSQVQTIMATAINRTRSFKEAVAEHAGEYGITNIEVLFPDARTIDDRPEWITRKMEWVEGVINGTRKLPFSRIKSLSADLTHEEARAKGYIKGDMKKDQFFAIAQRETTPKTIYKKQKLDRDDIVDITDFDVVAWMWVEMRFMLREEIARAILVGDGREVDDPDKISEVNIRPIAHDDEFYTDVVEVPANVAPENLVEAVLRARYQYKGTNPTAYMTNAVMTDMLLVKDGMGRRLYRTKAELAAELQVNTIVEVPVMEGVTRDGGEILMIIVNLSDYAVGSTRGGEITTFDDFDIDFNQYKYLIEGRMSGALMKHKTAQVIVRGTGTLATPAVPTFVPATGVITIPTVTGVTYKNKGTGATLSAGAQTALAAGASMEVQAVPNTGYYFPHNIDNDWVFTRPAA